MASALATVSRGAAVAPVRTHIDLGEGNGTYLISGALNELDILTVKVISVRPRNPERGLHSAARHPIKLDNYRAMGRVRFVNLPS